MKLPGQRYLLLKECSGRSMGNIMGLRCSVLERQVEEYNLRCGEICTKIEKSSGGTPLVAICSPLMKRVHQTRHSGESEDEATILLEGLQLLKDILREDAFAARGQADPRLIITDDCKAERGALGRPFQGAKL
ncbi:hypothetical protein J4Q44_G00074890 [Coregonus suidteri]|uniref:Uncharacterized protein n=1 Tax=Coregonus suidteri TaxID=861788 RepID=A0AAN8M9D0_9TELE